jgi:hypothetical protein
MQTRIFTQHLVGPAQPAISDHWNGMNYRIIRRTHGEEPTVQRKLVSINCFWEWAKAEAQLRAQPNSVNLGHEEQKPARTRKALGREAEESGQSSYRTIQRGGTEKTGRH